LCAGAAWLNSGATAKPGLATWIWEGIMDLAFTPEEQKFAADVRSFVKANLAS
jgi:hypothetical protein